MPRKKHTRSALPSSDAEEPMSKNIEQYVTTRQAAEMMGVKQDHIRKLLGQGKVRGIRLGHDWIVYIPSVEKYHETKSNRERPSSRTPQFQE